MNEESRPRVDIRREKVEQAARELFIRRGFHATGIAQIAEMSGIKVQQIYRDFANKEGIVAAIVERDAGTLFDEIPRIGSRTQGGRAALRAWIEQTLTGVVAGDQSPLFLEIFAEASRNARIAAILQDIELRVRPALIEAFVGFAGPTAERQHLSRVADLFFVFIGGISQRAIANPALDVAYLVDMMAEMIEAQIPQ
ncbi:TetR/AcrR family transcriptional regulator [Sphingomonas sp. RB3P16]|uniref:TetR/AcrR family transcriptional regulator n=1 Tax=Parasphingomonas frigoris TaxID=3096163 RepID=UPI002FCA5D5D